VPGGFPLERGSLLDPSFGTCKSIFLNLSSLFEVKDQYLIMMNKYHLSINVCCIDLRGRPPQTPLRCTELLYKPKILFPKAHK
jgi:hypothetical protein